MATLRTLGEIVDFLGEKRDKPATGAPAHHAAGPQAGSIARAISVGASASPVGRFAVRAVPAEPIGFATPGLFGSGPVAVTSDGGGVARALVERLRSRGVPAIAVDAVPADAGAVIFLGGLREVRRMEEALAVDREAFRAARAVAARFTARGGAFVTVQDTGGCFGLSGACGDRAWLAGVGALAKSAGDEWPLATARALDVERAERSDAAIADAIADELFHGGLESEVGLPADGPRVAVAAVAAPAPFAGRPVDAGAVFVVSGGARGVTAATLIELARASRPRLLLLGRTPLVDEPAAFHGVDGDAALKRAALDEARVRGGALSPREISARVDLVVAGREIRDTLRLLAQSGAEARYAAVDVRDASALAPILDGIRRHWGPIEGLVHGAGVLSDALLDKKTDAQFDRVFDTKVLGLAALLSATEGDPLRWICLFSSVAARAGNAGQADYAMANEVLNKVAAVEASRRGAGCRVVSIGWGPWEGGMVTPSLRRHFEARGVKLLPVAAGASAFVRELQGSGDVEVVIGGDVHMRPATTATLHADLLVDQRSYPQLADHRIKGKSVLPVVMAIEWFARLIAATLGERSVVELRDLRVVRGVSLPGHGGAGDRFQLVGRPNPDGTGLRIELRDGSDLVRYSAIFDPTVDPAVIAPARTLDLPPSPWSPNSIYGPGMLFHGPAFQVIRSVEGISKVGAIALLDGARDMGWPAGPWRTDAAALDGALQLAVLFGLYDGGVPMLPMRIARVVVHRPTVAGTLRCELRAIERTNERLVCDLAISGAAGAPLADLIGVEMFAIPSGTTVG